MHFVRDVLQCWPVFTLLQASSKRLGPIPAKSSVDRVWTGVQQLVARISSGRQASPGRALGRELRTALAAGGSYSLAVCPAVG